MKLTKKGMLKCASGLFILIGILLVGFTMKSIFIQPDYSIKTQIVSSVESVNQVDGIEAVEGVEGIDTIDPSKASYALGDLIGHVIIPSLDYELPLYEGTDDDQLKKGVGRYIGSAYPGAPDNCVISGHRDTVFTKLGDLEIGESIFVSTDMGLFTYEVKGIRIVEADDKTVIVPTDASTLTLTTCYPFVYIGAAPQRYIVSAERVE